MVQKVWQTDRRTDRQTDRRTENTICRTAWSQLRIPQTSITEIILKFSYLNFHLNIPGATELIQAGDSLRQWLKGLHHPSNIEHRSTCNVLGNYNRKPQFPLKFPEPSTLQIWSHNIFFYFCQIWGTQIILHGQYHGCWWPGNASKDPGHQQP